MKAFLVAAGLAAVAGCFGRSPQIVRNGSAGGSADGDATGSGGVLVGAGGSAGGAPVGAGGSVGSGGVLVGTGGSAGSGGAPVGTGGWVGDSGGVTAGTGGSVGSGGGPPTPGDAGGGGVGGSVGCLGRSPLGAGVGGGACEGGIRCINVKSATVGYETCGWLVVVGRASVFEAVRSCFERNPNFCALQPASVEACTGSVFAQACPGPGATVDGVAVDCSSVAANCPAVSQHECHLMTDILNDKYYQAAFECYVRQSPGPSDCGTVLRKCTGAPGTQLPSGTGGAGGTPSRNDGGQAACPDLAGTWTVTANCRGPGAFFNGSFSAVMAQAGCKLAFTQTDDQTGTQWVATGTIDGAGKGSLVGDFGFTDSRMCDLEAIRDAWTGRCGSATQSCELQAVKLAGP